jgi:hypothetical protein
LWDSTDAIVYGSFARSTAARGLPQILIDRAVTVVIGPVTHFISTRGNAIFNQSNPLHTIILILEYTPRRMLSRREIMCSVG